MKNLFLALSILITVISCNQKPEGYTINGTLSGDLEDGTKIFLRKQGDNNQPTDVDTTTVVNGEFTFTGQAGEPEIHYLFVDQSNGYTAIVLENGEIELSAQIDSLGLAKIQGTPQNDMLAVYFKKAQAMSQKGMAIQNDMKTANTNRDQVVMNSLNDEMRDFQEEYKSFEIDFIKENPNALISALLLEKAIAQRTVENEDVQGLYDALSAEVKATKVGKNIAKQIEAINVKIENGKTTAIGMKAPEFTAPGVNGEQLALKDMLGKITLIDFWAGWCKPCRLENPNVVAVYNKYHDKGLNVVGVSLDKTEEAWKSAIEKDGLTWNHVSHVQYFNDPIAKLYNVDAIPAAFLLDENGVIIAKNLRGPALEEKVAELLN